MARLKGPPHRKQGVRPTLELAGYHTRDTLGSLSQGGLTSVAVCIPYRICSLVSSDIQRCGVTVVSH